MSSTELVAATNNDSTLLTSTRVYISNVSYQVTEEELFDYFLSYNVKSVLIPSQTVRGFRTSYQRPLGIAYAEFENKDWANKVVADLNGKCFKERNLRIKLYIPYSPNNIVRNKLIKNKKEEETFTNDANNEKNADSNGENGTRSRIVVGGEGDGEKYCTDTLYCSYLPKETTDTTLRLYFKDYNPQEIWIFRTKATRGYRLKFHRYFTCALITLNTNVPMFEICERLNNIRLSNKKITVRVAFKSKLEEVKHIATKTQLVREQDIPIEEENQEDMEQNSSSNNNDPTKKAAKPTVNIITVEEDENDYEINNNLEVNNENSNNTAESPNSDSNSKKKKLKSDGVGNSDLLMPSLLGMDDNLPSGTSIHF
ncbi:hypothetical protein TBLA_0J01580 [Henningerozyma blattae CBS 6284]|uniref:Regulator of rDNA transcription protein 5 n=1 Tax=Henningerozyma blattae (strain ATCC 34711 / CBS 6284 / DSM 70876 / NBRC 10599 / NRRL Y-10934 / UCD 77-7) TaxID=1071380 RepID=I2H9V1_HENB6|nr:hypothetical protein TBLA_0J01580 [Tetrapisispora blattae CBS 6284]CCH63153.1 hypothetical protein TBLA_0J01580 [Tetrapisispora blattae CBS 6284]